MRTLLVLGCLLAALTPARASSFLDRPIDAWLGVLERGDTPQDRRGAAFALGRMGPVGAAALADLARRVRDDADASVRDMAAQAIGEIVLTLREPEGGWERCGATLLRAREDADPRVRRSAVYALGAFGTPAAQPALRAALADKSPEVRQNAAWALGRLGDRIDAAAVEALRDALADDSALVRRDAASALMTVAKKDGGRQKVAAAGPALFQMAKGEADAVARKTALVALGSVAGPEHADAADGVVPLLDSKDVETARAAALALAPVGGDHARKAVRVLRASLADEDATVQALGAAALGAAGRAAAPAAEDLARTLVRSKDPVVRRFCALALGGIGGDAKDGVPALAEALEARAADGDPARQELEDKVRESAAEALSHIHYPANEKAMPAVRRAIAKDPLPEVRLRCVEALFSIDKAAQLEEHGMKETLVAVLDERGEDSKLVRYNCARVLAKTYAAEAPDEATRTLLVMLADTATRIFYRTEASGVGGVEGGGDTKATALTGGSARFLAAQALGWMGAKSKDDPAVMAALRKAVKDPEAKLAEAAKKALAALSETP